MGLAAFDVLVQNDKDPKVRRFVLDFFRPGQLTSEEGKPLISPRSLEILLAHIQGKDAELRDFALYFLSSAMMDEQLVESAVKIMGAKNKTGMEKAIQVLLAIRDNGEYPTGLATLKAFGPREKDAIPVMINAVTEQLKDKEAQSHLITLAWLSEMGFKARPAIPSLLERLNDSNENLRRGVIVTLDILMEPEMKEHTLGGNKDSYYLVRKNWDDQCRSYFSDPHKGIPILLRAFMEYQTSDRCRQLLAEALGKMGPAAQEALPALREASKAQNPEVRKAAASAIEKITRQEKK